LKGKAFSTLLNQNPPFELPPKCLSRLLEARIEGKLDSYPAGLPHDEMDFWASTRGFRTELDDNPRPTRYALVKGIKAGSIGDSECQMMQTDIGAPIERDRFARRFDLPQRHHVVPIGYECRWIDCHSACNIDPLSRGIGVQN
jgi:hypothetical protein